jgi:hypothetical protein
MRGKAGQSELEGSSAVAVMQVRFIPDDSTTFRLHKGQESVKSAPNRPFGVGC